eukprot:3962826-Pyramimonas_sp.AAC.1
MTRNNTNRFANLARLADRVQTSQFNRRTRLIILNRCAHQLFSWSRARVILRKTSPCAKMTRNGRSRCSVVWQ